MKLLVLGGEGQLGRSFKSLAGVEHEVLSLARSDCDITNAANIDRICSPVNADVVINCAAYTNVAKAESSEEEAMLVNGLGAKNLAEFCERYALPFVHISTDFVFDGSKVGAYTERDLTRPINIYGKSKAFGEQMVREYCSRHIILRTSWVFSEFGTNFLKTMLGLLKVKRHLRVVSDEFGNPFALH